MNASTAISLLALLISLVTGGYTLWDRYVAAKENRPRLGWELRQPGLEDPYGFFIRNVGGTRARVKEITYGYVSDTAKAEADAFFEELFPEQGQYFLFQPGPEYTLEPGEHQHLHVFTRPLEGEEFARFDAYTRQLAAEILYCDVRGSRCWKKTVSVLPDVAGAEEAVVSE